MYGKLDWRMYYISFQAHSVIILSIELIGVFAFGTIIRCGIFFCQFTISAVSRSIYTKFGTNFLHVIVVLPFCKKQFFEIYVITFFSRFVAAARLICTKFCTNWHVKKKMRAISEISESAKLEYFKSHFDQIYFN